MVVVMNHDVVNIDTMEVEMSTMGLAVKKAYVLLLLLPLPLVDKEFLPSFHLMSSAP